MFQFRQWCEQAWKAEKKDIINLWHNLPNSVPLQALQPVPPGFKGSTYAFDGVRVTGSQQFINAVISRLKELLNYESGNTKLHLLYHQQVDRTTQQPLPNSFVFYIQVRDRSKNADKLQFPEKDGERV